MLNEKVSATQKTKGVTSGVTYHDISLLDLIPTFDDDFRKLFVVHRSCSDLIMSALE